MWTYKEVLACRWQFHNLANLECQGSLLKLLISASSYLLAYAIPSVVLHDIQEPCVPTLGAGILHAVRASHALLEDKNMKESPPSLSYPSAWKHRSQKLISWSPKPCKQANVYTFHFAYCWNWKPSLQHQSSHALLGTCCEGQQLCSQSLVSAGHLKRSSWANKVAVEAKRLAHMRPIPHAQ